MPEQTHRWVIDAIADRVAAIEIDGDRTVRLPRWVLPRGAREGDVLAVRHTLDAEGERSALVIEIDRAATEAARRASREQVDAIRNQSHRRDPGGDVVL
jgi:Protein of unknown function (DUF3006)